MEEDDDESRARRRNLAAFSSLRTMHTSVEDTAAGHLACDAAEGNTHSTVATALYTQHSHVTKTSAFSRSGTSSSSQEDGEAAHTTVVSGQYLAATRVESARSMESLRPSKESSPARPASSCTTVRTHRGSFLTASERDVREVRGMPTRRALSGEDVGPTSASAEKRRGLFAGGERRALQQLSLPPPERRLTILSPHSPLAATELQWPSPTGIRGRRKKGMVLPKLILPRSDSDGSDVFFERCI
ncbi:hypothetical protein EVAR_16067_1 [Eumeta japonica]|uniref:Uncharacterized protein n=1 Tax=Eumeta variegata TaxID=151549 RepID=A0A4C1UJT2_EUMVA|nr:hypothetical protein EVAR_16067_1 [Eumeta japonica]